MPSLNLEFAWPWALAAAVLPLLAAALLPPARLRPPALKVPFYADLGVQAEAERGGHSAWRLALAVLAWLLLVMAAARPQFVGDPVRVPLKGRDLMLAVDISGSMRRDDMEIGGMRMDRLSAVKAVAGEFLERRKGDRVGLILFGRNAYLQTPLTFDRKTVAQLLNESAIGLAGKETAIGDAIGLAVKKLREEPEGNRVLILLTDGANTAGVVDPLKAADLAAREEVRIYTIGFGADSMIVQGLFGPARVPNADLDEASLRAIAAKTGGRYFRARNVEQLQEIYDLLDELEPVSEEEQTYRPVRELYLWPLGLSLLLSVLLAVSHLLPSRWWFRDRAAEASGHA